MSGMVLAIADRGDASAAGETDGKTTLTLSHRALQPYHPAGGDDSHADDG
jgi:hypothetical protein